MRSDIFKEAKIGLCVVAAILTFSVLFYIFASMFVSMGYRGLRDKDALAENPSIIVIDAGHGGEDPGATNGSLSEKELNLDVALKLNSLLSSAGYATVLTRDSDRLLYEAGQEDRKKFHDVRNRRILAEQYENAIFVSIHMNKFPQEYCKGLQTFYSENNESSLELALSIQGNAKQLQQDNNRTVKSGNKTIYLMNTLKIPSVLVECGFISNNYESALLATEDYRAALALTLFCGISEFFEKQSKEVSV